MVRLSRVVTWRAGDAAGREAATGRPLEPAKREPETFGRAGSAILARHPAVTVIPPA